MFEVVEKNTLKKYLPEIVANTVDNLNTNQLKQLAEKVYKCRYNEYKNLGIVLQSMLNINNNLEQMKQIVKIVLDITIQDIEIKEFLIQSEILEIVDGETDYDYEKIVFLYLSKIKSCLLQINKLASH